MSDRDDASGETRIDRELAPSFRPDLACAHFDPLDAIEAVRIIGDCVDVAHVHLTRRSGGTLRFSVQEAHALARLLLTACDEIERGRGNPEL